MVWFQCEDCGDNLKKPKLPNHFRVCSAFKLSCIDCGEVFGQHNVESHTQCISEAEKYGPKGGNVSNGVNSKPKLSKPKPEVDINVGLSDRPPWFCSLCNTKATSQQTLLLHADGKKHRGKAKGFQAAKQQPNDAKETNDVIENNEKTVHLESKDLTEPKDQNVSTVASLSGTEIDVSKSIKKRKLEAEGDAAAELSNDGVTAASKNLKKTKRCMMKKDEKLDSTPEKVSGKKEIKWKKLITSALKSKSDGVLKLKKLKKLVLKSLEESGFTKDKKQVSEMLEHKIKSSSRFVIDGKIVRLATSN